jgi:hypothetical protein
MEDGEAALRKELSNVKKRAVDKIRALTAQVETLEKKLLEKTRASPPESASSDASDLGDREKFVKVNLPAAATAADEQRALSREAELQSRERELLLREREVASREAALAKQSSLGWQAALLKGLRTVGDNLTQIDLVTENTLTSIANETCAHPGVPEART